MVLRQSMSKYFRVTADYRPNNPRKPTYDFCVNGRGQIGGDTLSTLWDKPNYAAGVEYGYSLPIAKQLNLDFCLGVGYMGGEYKEYTHMDDCYVWQVTKSRHLIGPTKAEISLVWIIGR